MSRQGNIGKLWLKSMMGLVLSLIIPAGVARGQCPCDCDVNGSGLLCNALDIVAVGDCVGMPPVGGCAGSDVNCDGVIDDVDVDAAVCGFRGLPPEACCHPPFGTATHYQGHIVSAGLPVTGDCDFEFSLWDAPAAGAMVGPLLDRPMVSVSDGVFTVDLNFGWHAMDGFPRWLEISVLCPSGPGALTLLTPRTEFTPAPYSVRAGTGIGGPLGLNLTTDGNVGIGTADPTEKLVVAGNIEGALIFVTSVFAEGISVVGGVVVGPALRVTESSDTVASFNRSSTDGTIVEIQQGGTTEGTISVAGAVVSYNAFTGSHYAWMDKPIRQGELVKLTGVNRRLHASDASEIIYGVLPAGAPNDPTCLGAYLGLQEPLQPPGLENPHLVMAVGNGDMWVVDTGRSIRPGDYLLSSDLSGHAMLDDEQRFPVGYVVARAGEPVDWASVSETIEGRKHKKVSVFFESFVRGSTAGLGRIVESQQREIGQLKERMETLERALSSPTNTPLTITQAGIPMGLLALVVVLAVRRRSAKGGGQ